MTDDDLDELAIYWWGPNTDDCTVTEVIECGSMAAFARFILETSNTQNND